MIVLAILISLFIHLMVLVAPIHFQSLEKQTSEIPPLFISPASLNAGRENNFSSGTATPPSASSNSQGPIAIQEGLAAGGRDGEVGITADEIVKNGNVLPAYPREAVEHGWEGTVHLKLSLSEQGNVIKTDVIKSSGFPILDLVAVKTSERWKFGFFPPVKTVIAPIKFVLGS